MAVATQTIQTIQGQGLLASILPFRRNNRRSADIWDESVSGSPQSPSSSQYDSSAVSGNLVNVPVKALSAQNTEPRVKVYSVEEEQRLRIEIENMFEYAKDEVFEDGMESTFSLHLLRLLEEHGEFAMNQIVFLVEEKGVSSEVLAETLRWFGLMEDGPAYAHRRWLLQRCLKSSSVIVRDGAILGLSFLEDPRSIPILEQAYYSEIHESLRADILQVLNDLKELPAGFK